MVLSADSTEEDERTPASMFSSSALTPSRLSWTGLLLSEAWIAALSLFCLICTAKILSSPDF